MTKDQNKKNIKETIKKKNSRAKKIENFLYSDCHM